MASDTAEVDPCEMVAEVVDNVVHLPTRARDPEPVDPPASAAAEVLLPAETAPITFTSFSKPKHAKYHVRKVFSLDEAGNRVKGDRQDFYEGVQKRWDTTLGKLYTALKHDATTRFAFFTAGVTDKADAVVKFKEFGRTKDNFRFPEGAALLVLDGDALDEWWLEEPVNVVEVYRQIGVDSDLVTSSSASSYLRWPTGETELKGLHSFAAIDKGTAIPDVLLLLHKRAWLKGYGRILVGENGVLHPRSIVDTALKTSNQPIFEYGAVLLDPRITQDRQVDWHTGTRRMLRSADIPALTEAEEAQVADLIAEAKRKAQPEAERVTEVWLEKRLEGVSVELRDARREKMLADRNKTRRDLANDFLVTLNNGSTVSVVDIKSDPDRFHGMSIRDPYEPEYGPGHATIVTKDQTDGRPKILSRAHGQDIVYFLDKRVSTREPFPNPDQDQRPCAIVLDDWTEIPAVPPDDFHTDGVPAKPRRPGLWWFETVVTKSGPVNRERWLSEPFHLDAQTCDGVGNNYGRLLRFRTTTGTWRTWALPMEMLGGDASALIGCLMGMGLGTDGKPDGKQRIVEYLASSRPERQMRCVPQIGWTGDTFVLPDGNIGPGGDDIVLQSSYTAQLNEMHGTAGSFDNWRAGVADVAVGNTWLVLGLSAAFAGPLLERTQNGSGGLHLIGESSIGKTTILDAACSVWGGKPYKRTWLLTANGLEGTAAMTNGCLLALDEISQCEPNHIGNVIYMIGNEIGKQRADKSGAARTPTRHKTVVISTGETSIADAMLVGGKRQKAGQSVRLIDVMVGGRYGCFDELHGHATGKQFVDAITAAAASHYGHAGRRFLAALVQDEQDLVARLAATRSLSGFNLEHADGQRERVASRFALFALAGELASEYGVTGWAPGTATQAAVKAFETWHQPRGKGSAERQQALAAILAFIERHGDSRFSDSSKPEGVGPAVRDRAGCFQDVKVGADQEIEREYLFHSEGMRDALVGVDFNGAIRALGDAGVLPPPDKEGKRTRVKKIGGTATRVYPILPRKVQAALDGVRDDAEVRVHDPFADE